MYEEFLNWTDSHIKIKSDQGVQWILEYIDIGGGHLHRMNEDSQTNRVGGQDNNKEEKMKTKGNVGKCEDSGKEGENK